ncbi:MAG: ribosomal protein S18-alanine N-acetyltransferase [Candidatus Lambdaproteobacteria bacterium]|nr:ribosomal protein S18-alanine N-acetyltransferase [Candidatus Lambdaproteobacteria bacterium]
MPPDGRPDALALEKAPAPEAVAGLERRCFDEPWDADTYCSLLANPAVRAWLLLDARGQGIGLLSFQQVADEAELYRIGVVPEHRRNGQGRRLLAHWLGWLRARGIRRVALEVRADNMAAQALYRAVGFREAGRRPGYYARGAADALVYVVEWDGATSPPAATP